MNGDNPDQEMWVWTRWQDGKGRDRDVPEGRAGRIY